ncbi:reverse transcriptase [Gossypium australe]|uniref:Reverse transcriptase n=1 Tax=Gossypium australe TaxID=47621 RepID=A0A5B6VAR2_9ROSI|nr:reverse transcriptase [Gossypium australe]
MKPGSCLGLPVVAITDRFLEQIGRWYNRCLSQGGKAVFIKSILQDILIYSCSGEGLCDLKEVGGLGFRSLSKVNIALPAKQGWHLLTNPNSLMARVVKDKYFPNNSFMEVSIWATKCLLQMGCGWQVNNWRSISVWNNAWLPGGLPCKIQSNRVSGIDKVVDLIDIDRGEWNIELLRDVFPNPVVRHIQCIPLDAHDLEDQWRWFPKETGVYSVWSGYKLLLRCFLWSDGYIRELESLSLNRAGVVAPGPLL